MYENIQEGQYLIKLLSSAINNKPLEPPTEDLDWEKLYSLASFHNVANTACYSLLKLPNQDFIPEPILKKFTSDTREISSQEALSRIEMRNILNQYETQHIFCVPLSDYVMRPLYPRPDMRYVSTIQFLIRPDDKTLTHRIMTKSGYTLVRSSESTLTYYKEPHLTIELVTSLVAKNNEFYDYFASIVKHNLKPKKGLTYIHSLSKEDFYIYMLTYLAHKYSAGSSDIRSVLDIWIYLKRYNPVLDRDFIAQELNKLNLGLFSFYIEELAWVWFGGAVAFSDESLYEEMEQHIFSCGMDEYLNVGREDKESHAATPEETLSEEERDTLFPNLEVMSNRYPILQKMPFLLPIFWLVRLSSSLLTRSIGSQK